MSVLRQEQLIVVTFQWHLEYEITFARYCDLYMAFCSAQRTLSYNCHRCDQRCSREHEPMWWIRVLLLFWSRCKVLFDSFLVRGHNSWLFCPEGRAKHVQLVWVHNCLRLLTIVPCSILKTKFLLVVPDTPFLSVSRLGRLHSHRHWLFSDDGVRWILAQNAFQIFVVLEKKIGVLDSVFLRVAFGDYTCFTFFDISVSKQL